MTALHAPTDQAGHSAPASAVQKGLEGGGEGEGEGERQRDGMGMGKLSVRAVKAEPTERPRVPLVSPIGGKIKDSTSTERLPQA